MHIIFGLALLVAFYYFAPRFFKWLFTINISAIVLYIILLRICAMVIGAGKGGRNSGVLQEYASLYLYMLGTATLIFILGLFAAIATHLVKKKMNVLAPYALAKTKHPKRDS